MKMEGDPNVTAWGVMRGQALDLITPQQVVGGLLLMNAEEKACLALQPRLEILAEQGELMSAPHPLLSQHDESLLGAGEGQQLGDGHCQSRHATTEPWTGEEDGRLTLCTLNLLPPDSAPIYKPSMDDQLPPLIIAPSANAHLPLCPAPFIPDPEHTLEVPDPPVTDYIVDVRSLLIPDPKSDQDAPGSALGSHQVPVPMNSLSPDLQFTNEMHQDGEVPLENDQITPLESHLPLKIDQPCDDQPLLDPDVELFTHFLPQLEPILEELSESETLVDRQDDETESLPHPESHLLDDFDQLPQPESSQLPQCAPCLPQSESNIELETQWLQLIESFEGTQINSRLVPNPDLLPVPKSSLDSDPEQLPQTESELDSDSEQLPQTESVLDSDPEHFSQTESELDAEPEQLLQTGPELNSDPNQLPKSESELDSDSEQLPQTESVLDFDHEQLPQTESVLDFDHEKFPQTEQVLDFDHEQLPQTESVLGFDHEQLPQTESVLDFDHEQFPQTESVLDFDHEQLPQTESVLDFDHEQLPQTESVLDFDHEQLPQTESVLDFDHEQLPQTESVLDFDHEQLPQTESVLDFDHEQLLQTESVLDFDHEQLPQTESVLDFDHEQLPQTESVLDFDHEQLPQTESVLDFDHEQLPQTESVLDFDHEQLPQTESVLDFDHEQLPQTESVLDFDHEQLPQTESVLDFDHEQLPQTESVLDFDHEQLPQTESVLDFDHEQLPQTESVLDFDHEQLPQTESVLDSDPEQFPQTELELDSDLERFPQTEPELGYDPEQVPQSESELDNDSEQLPQTESVLDSGLEHLSRTESESNSDPERFPQIEPELVSDPEQLPQTESDSDPEHFPQTELELDSDPERLLQTEPDLDHNREQLTLSKPVVDSEELLHPNLDAGAQFDCDPEELPLSESIVVTEELPKSISQLVAQSESDCDPLTDPLPQSEKESCLTPDHDLPYASETSPDLCVLEPKLLPEISVTSDLSPHSIACLAPNTGPLPLYDHVSSTEYLHHSQPIQDCVDDPLEYFCPGITQPEYHLDTNELFESESDPPKDHSQLCLDPDIETFNLAESFMAHEADQSIESSVHYTDPLFLDSTLPDISFDSVHLQPELPHMGHDKVACSYLLPHSELSLDVEETPNSESILDRDPDRLPWFELSMCANTAHLPFSTHSVNEGESSLAHEADELSLCDPFLAPDHYEFSVPKFALSIPEQLTIGDPYLEPSGGQSSKTESSSDMDHEAPFDPQVVPNIETSQKSETFLTPDTEHLPHSKDLLDQDADRLTDSSLDSDQLPKVEIFLDSDHVPVLSETLDIEQLPESCLVDNSMRLDGRPEFESCLTLDDDLFFLSETFLAHDLDHVPVLDHSMTPETDQISSSELREVDQTEPSDQISSSELREVDQTEPCKPFDYDHLPQHETLLSPHTDQLAFSYNDQLTFLSPHNDQLESCDHLPQPESCVYQESEQLSQTESNLGPDPDKLSPTEACLDSDSDELPCSETPLSPSGDQLAQTELHLVLNRDLLPQLETQLDLESDDVSQCESHSEHPHSLPHTGQVTQFETGFHQDSDHFALSEYKPPPDTTKPNVFESTSTPDQIPLVASPSCPDTDVLSLAHDPDSLFDIECPLFETPPTLHTDHLPLSKSFMDPNLDMLPLVESTVVHNTGEMPFSEILLTPSIDHFRLLESTVPPTATQLLEPSIPHNAMTLPLCDGLTYSENPESLTPPSFSPSETPETVDSTNMPSCDSSIAFDTPSSTNLPIGTPEEFQFSWDWTLNLPPMDNLVVEESSHTATKQHDEPEDSFSIFCLDTPPDSNHMSPEADLTLSDDLLSLCDVFLNLQTSDIHSESDQSPISTTNGQTDQLAPKDLESNSPPEPDPLHSASPASDHKFLNSENDQLDSYCLDLLFEPPNLESLASEQLLQPKPRTSTEEMLASTNSKDSASQICINGSPLVDTNNNSGNSSLSQPDTSLISSRFGQSSSQMIDDLSSLNLEAPSERTQLPVIVVTDPLELLSASDNHTDDILATNALPLDTSPSSEMDSDAHLQVAEVPSCEIEDLPELKLDPYEDNQSTTGCPDSLKGSPPSPQPQSDSTLGTTLPSFMSTGELPLTSMGSPFESIKLRSRDSQDSACALMAFGEGDPLLAFSLDSDSPCAGDELARLRAVFDALDRDKDGFVKMEDFVQFATVYGAEQVKYLTGYLDPAGLGVINFRDFYRGISEIQNEDLDMQLYDMGYPSEEEPACSVDFDDLAAFEVTEVTDSAYVGSESAYSECETFTDEDTGGLAAQEDPETEGDGAGSRGHAPATPEGLELSLCDISGVTVTGQEEQFEDFGEGAEPDLFNSHCEEEQESFTQTPNTSQRLTSSGAPVSERQLLAPPPCSGLGGLYCSQCHKHINRLEDLSTRLRYLEMDSPDKRTSSRKEARRLHHSGFLEDQGEQPLTNMACDDTDLTDKVLYLEQRVSELERDAAMTGEQQNRLRQENLHLLHRAHALEEQLKDQELRSDEVQSEETRKHRDELRKMERDRGFRLSSLKARVQELENENVELRSQLPSAKATTQRLEEEKHKLLDQVEELQRQLKENQEQNRKLGGKLSKEKHKQQLEKERCQEVIEELRRELEQTQLLRLEMEQRMGLGNSAALQEYNSRTREAELEHEVRRLKQEQRLLKEQNEELNGQIINLSIQGAKNLFSTTFSDSLAAEISSVSRDELMEAIQKQEEINLRLQDYIDRIIVAIMETNPAILEVK
ncbi:rab11 family-interacting protein 3 [Leptodactylus fuscus]